MNVEPTSALDEETSEAVEKYLLGVLHSHETLKALVWITHSKGQEQRVATRHLSMETGGVITVNEPV
jgi:ABC-type iron transport system FetAB ATPase subunit